MTNSGALSLTAAGVQAHSRVSSRVKATRGRLLDGLTREDYATVVRLLEHMAMNLEDVVEPHVSSTRRHSARSSSSNGVCG